MLWQDTQCLLISIPGLNVNLHYCLPNRSSFLSVVHYQSNCELCVLSICLTDLPYLAAASQTVYPISRIECHASFLLVYPVSLTGMHTSHLLQARLVYPLSFDQACIYCLYYRPDLCTLSLLKRPAYIVSTTGQTCVPPLP